MLLLLNIGNNYLKFSQNVANMELLKKIRPREKMMKNLTKGKYVIGSNIEKKRGASSFSDDDIFFKSLFHCTHWHTKNVCFVCL